LDQRAPQRLSVTSAPPLTEPSAHTRAVNPRQTVYARLESRRSWNPLLLCTSTAAHRALCARAVKSWQKICRRLSDRHTAVVGTLCRNPVQKPCAETLCRAETERQPKLAAVARPRTELEERLQLLDPRRDRAVVLPELEGLALPVPARRTKEVNCILSGPPGAVKRPSRFPQ
jgi:hypothetical protein